MRNKVKTVVRTLLFLTAIMAAGMGMGKVAEGKTKTDRMELKHKYTVKTVYYDYKNGVKDSIYLTSNVKKIKVKYSKKGYVKNVKITKLGNLKWLPVKAGKTTLTVKGYTKKGKYYGTWKIKMKVKSAKAMSKKAFKIQNKYRKSKGKTALQWSDTLYELAQYRLSTSGYDGHKNCDSDTQEFLIKKGIYIDGLFTTDDSVQNGENLASGQGTASYVMKSWKRSAGHYRNLLDSEWKCGAIAYMPGKNIWCAVFFSVDKNAVENSSSDSYAVVNIKRYDSTSKTYYNSGCSFSYYQVGNKNSTKHRVSMYKSLDTIIWLEIGKKYVIYEESPPNGCEKAERITVTITEDTKEIILKS